MCSVRDKSKTYAIHGDIQLGDLAPDGHQLRPFIVWFEEPVPMMEEAVMIAEEADIFVVIGTSLQVYPAASLIQYIHRSIPKYIIDKKILPTPGITNIISIEATASEGMKELKNLLQKNFN